MIVCIGGGDGERDASPPQPQSIRNAGVSLADVLMVPCMEVAMGHPLKLVVLEQTTKVTASPRFDGGFDMLKIRSTDLSCSTPEQSPATLNIPLPPQIIISEELSVLLRSRIHQQAAEVQIMII
ncbi:hypothetical protein D5086_026760 [Populus alba]|uniref:Uncharacterized protein n=1 Tax=Populus alba TaxID=43335 RepID=A0ACC4B3H3_POPAL